MNNCKLIPGILFCLFKLSFGVDPEPLQKPSIVINNYGSNSRAESTTITKSQSNFFTNFSFTNCYENTKSFLKENWSIIRPSLIAVGIVGLYVYLVNKCLDVNYLFDPKSDSWVSWKLGTTADTLVATPPQNLYSEMIPELKRKYFFSTEKNTILSYIKIFGLKVDNEIGKLEWYKKLMGLGALSWGIDKTLVVKVPSLTDVDESIRKLKHMKSVAASNFPDQDEEETEKSKK